jgi:hypothetical protein
MIACVRRLGVSNGFDFSVNIGTDFEPVIEFGFVKFLASTADVFDDVTRKEVKALVNDEVPDLNFSLLVMRR